MVQIFLNELSLQNQFLNDTQVNDAIDRLKMCFTSLKKSLTRHHIYYCNLYLNFPVMNNILFDQIQKSGMGTEDRVNFFKTVIEGAINWKSASNHTQTTNTYSLILPYLDVYGYSIAEAVERLSGGSATQIAIINFSGSEFCPPNSFQVLKNGDTTFNVSSFDLDNEITSWLQTLVPPIDAFLHNKDRFVKTKMNDAGAQVYHEFKKNRHWYLDTLHKDRRHFEVFDHRGNHVAEANLEGEFIADSKDKKKRYRP